MTACMTKINLQKLRNVVTQNYNAPTKRSNIDGEAWIRMRSAIGCQGWGGMLNHNTGHCTLPQQPRFGNVYDNSGRLIGTYVEN
jgi:hypothetical protein